MLWKVRWWPQPDSRIQISGLMRSPQSESRNHIGIKVTTKHHVTEHGRSENSNRLLGSNKSNIVWACGRHCHRAFKKSKPVKPLSVKEWTFECPCCSEAKQSTCSLESTKPSLTLRNAWRGVQKHIKASNSSPSLRIFSSSYHTILFRFETTRKKTFCYSDFEEPTTQQQSRITRISRVLSSQKT